MTVGVLGMAFADSGHPRVALPCCKILGYEAAQVICTDVYIKDPSFRSLAETVELADLLILAAPHREYREFTYPDDKPMIDIWNYFGNGACLT